MDWNQIGLDITGIVLGYFFVKYMNKKANKKIQKQSIEVIKNSQYSNKAMPLLENPNLGMEDILAGQYDLHAVGVDSEVSVIGGLYSNCYGTLIHLLEAEEEIKQIWENNLLMKPALYGIRDSIILPYKEGAELTAFSRPGYVGTLPMEAFLRSSVFTPIDHDKEFLDIIVIKGPSNHNQRLDNLKHVGLYLGKHNGRELMFSQDYGNNFEIVAVVDWEDRHFKSSEKKDIIREYYGKV